MVAFDFIGSQEAIEQFEQAMGVEEAFLACYLCLCVDCFPAAFGCARAAMLPSNMVDGGLRQMVPLVVGRCYEPSCDTLSQPLPLPGCCRTMVANRSMEVVQHRVGDVYHLNVAFVGLRKLLDL